MVKKNTKNQHYVASSLLRFFANKNDRIFEFLVNESKEAYPTKPDNAMSARYIYEHNLLKINTIEEVFARSVDNALPKAIKKIIEQIEALETSEHIEKIHKEMKKYMGLFLINYYRSGALLEEFSTDGKEKKIELMLRKILDFEYIKGLSKTINSLYKFAIIKSDNEFLISDQYISTAAIKVKSQFIEVSNRNIGLKETIILIPISSKYYTVFWNSEQRNIFEKSRVNLVNGATLENINRVIVNNSYKKCVGGKKSACDFALKKFSHSSASKIITAGLNFIKKKEVFWDEKEMIFWKSFKWNELPKKFSGLGRNDKCLCGSDKKFKKCHIDYEEWWNKLASQFDGYPFTHVKKGIGKSGHVIEKALTIEGPIDQS